ncbi:ash family protein [Salmonella enterica]
MIQSYCTGPLADSNSNLSLYQSAICIPPHPIAVFDRKRYLLPVPAKSGAGIGTPRNVTGDIRRAPRLFLCRALGYTSMVGWAGAPQGAPVACNAGSSNPVQSTTMRLEPLVVGF